jgi:hypothetical protein
MPRWQPRVLPTEQTCSRCKATKPLDQFPMRCDRAEPLKRCRACNDEEQAQRAKDIEDNARGLRECVLCKKTKPFEDFALRGKNRPNERHFRCRTCVARVSNTHYNKTRERETLRASAGKAALLASGAKGRTCAECKDQLPLEFFAADTRSNDGYKRICVHCDRVTRYGISRTVIERLWEFQNQSCRVCGEPQTLFGRSGIHVDHDHVTGKVRGLLCAGCNVALGAVRENPEILVGLIQYLIVTAAVPAPGADLAAWDAYLQAQEKTPLAGGLSQVRATPAKS